ncbi:CBF-domain-containing protein [Fistulina hepatica ATCC 64428]|uniref:CBF-domain-containing protein n=1 Tax=Fistulina hepatica ATCC 64428 TaxID=1128425 RepID=A0A0D7A092_9AGAR|nr:CBF-domain-containing protein [Fistulina hepatica ATCC 64428]
MATATSEGKGKEREIHPALTVTHTALSKSTSTHTIVHPSSQWYTEVEYPNDSPSGNPSSSASASLLKLAADLHAADIQLFSNSRSSSSSEQSFLTSIIHSGTLSDRLSALTLLVQSSPVHNTQALETLKSMASTGREDSLKALRCIVDWWVGGGVPDRKLRYFTSQPLHAVSATSPTAIQKQLLITWYFEDWLKKYFFSVLQILESHTSSPLPYMRTRALALLATLLTAKPEQEHNLLRLVVFKLGDPTKSICAKASHHVLQLLQTHPSMKSVVVREIMGLVFKNVAVTIATLNGGAATTTTASGAKHMRFDDPASVKAAPKVGQKSGGPAPKAGNAHVLYYASITLNQIVLTTQPADQAVARTLIDFYFEMFREVLGAVEREETTGMKEKKTGSSEEKSAEGDQLKVDRQGRVIDYSSKKKGKGLVASSSSVFAEPDEGDAKLISALLTGVNRALPFAKFGAGDVTNPMYKHMDMLFLITHKSTFNTSLQALVLIQQICATLMKEHPGQHVKDDAVRAIADRFYRVLYASLHDARLATSNKQALYLNLFIKAVREDINGSRVAAVVKRFIQTLISGGNGSTEFVAGGLVVLGQLFDTTPGLRGLVTRPPSETAKADKEASSADKSAASYDPLKRDPQYAHAETSPLWELLPLTTHYHPTIALHAGQLLRGESLSGSADLSLNTLSHFLDRFVYKNPKKIREEDGGGLLGAKSKGASLMQPAASGLDGIGVKLHRGEVSDVIRSDGGGVQVKMNEEAFLRRKKEDVPADQLFFYQYFTRKHERDKARVKGENEENDDDEDIPGDDGAEDENEGGSEGGDDDDSDARYMDLSGDEEEERTTGAGQATAKDQNEEGSDAEEQEIWTAMKATMPQEGEDADDDVDSDSEGSDGEDDDAVDSNFLRAMQDDDEDDGLAETSDNEDLTPFDGGLIEFDGSENAGGEDENEDEWGGVDDSFKKRKRSTQSDDKLRRKKLKSLPTFASYEDYAKMIEDGPEDDI